MTKYIGVIGYPLKHSLSPAFQQAALDYYQFDIRYQAWETEAEELSSVVNNLRYNQNLGANITVPYKESVLELIDDIDDMARLIGAVNTIANRNGKLIGFNTDVYGFLRGLREDAGFNPENKRAIVLGAGGAARAVTFALITEGISSLAIVNRSSMRANDLADSITRYILKKEMQTEVIALTWQDLRLRETIKQCHLIVNCTTLGMKYSSGEEKSPLTVDLIPKYALVYDLVYNPSETVLLKTAKAAGADILGGLSMLVYQGASSFEIWTGKEAPVEIMLSTAKKVLFNIGGQI